MADEGKIVKMEVDYSSTVDQKLPECEKLAKEGKLTEALEALLSLEKMTRTAADMHSTSRVLQAIVKFCYDAHRWDTLMEHIVMLTKKRSQLKQAIAKMIQECCTYVEQTPDKETKLKLIETLRTVTAGKIYVEIERARLTLLLAKIKEDDGDIAGAADVLQELQVETFGSMERKEKVEFILEQMRLCMARKDYVRTQIISKKINTKFFEDSTTNELKLKYYKLMIDLDQHEGSYLATCKHYRAVHDTPSIQEDKQKWQMALKCAILYVILAPYDNEQADLIHRIKEEKNLDDIAKYRDLLKLFTTNEIMRWASVCELYEDELRKGSAESPATDVFDPNTDAGQKCWEQFKKRVVEHNIRVLAKYYRNIRLARMAELIDLTEAETEEFLSNLVVNKTVQAKTDRLAGMVSFMQHKDPSDLLNEWSFNINSLMQLVNKTTHLINKEEMIHNLTA